MIDREHELPLARQAEWRELSGGSLYPKGRPGSLANLAIMRRMLRDLLRGEGIVIGRDRVVSRMRRMGIVAIYPVPGTKITRICCVTWWSIDRTRFGQRFRRERPQPPGPAELAAIRQLTTDLPALWQAPTTTGEERQTIVRL